MTGDETELRRALDEAERRALAARGEGVAPVLATLSALEERVAVEQASVRRLREAAASLRAQRAVSLWWFALPVGGLLGLASALPLELLPVVAGATLASVLAGTWLGGRR